MLPLTAIAALLRCPRCRSALAETGGSCSNPACGMHFERAGRQPILIDASNSIVYPASIELAIESRGGPLRRLLDRLGEQNRVAPDVSEKIRAELVARTHGRRPIVLVVGGGSIGSGIDSLYDDPAIDLIGFDVYPSRHTQFVADGHAIPLADSSVDAVVIQAVLEHVRDPARVVAEIHRVLRADGLIYADTPFLQHVHEGPFDFTRFTESGHRWLFRHFELIESGHVAGVGAGLCWSIAHVAQHRAAARRQSARTPGDAPTRDARRPADLAATRDRRRVERLLLRPALGDAARRPRNDRALSRHAGEADPAARVAAVTPGRTIASRSRARTSP